MKQYSDRKAAIDDGKDEKSLVELEWRTDEERDALMLAAEHGNRERRRHFHPERSGDGGGVAIERTERDRRNAKNRTARKSRKTNNRRNK